MSIPKFKVGEEFILVSDTNREFNGDYVIKGIQSVGKEYSAHPDYYPFAKTNYIRYDLGIRTDEYCAMVREYELRKKYPPATETWEQMKANLKIKEVV